MYQTFKNVVDEDFSKEFSSYTGKALLCWGNEDTATPLSSGEKIDELMQDPQLQKKAALIIEQMINNNSKKKGR